RLWLVAEERCRLRGEPVEQVLRLHEAAGVRPRSEHDDRHLLAALTLREPQQRRQTIAGLRDEPGLPRAHVDVLAAEEMVRAVERDRTLLRVDRVLRRAHDRGDPLVARRER